MIAKDLISCRLRGCQHASRHMPQCAASEFNIDSCAGVQVSSVFSNYMILPGPQHTKGIIVHVFRHGA
jgi:hypothetical protein